MPSAHHFRLLIILFFVIINSACSVLQPVHETQVPETLGPWGFNLGIIAGSSPTIATPLASTLDTTSYSLPLEGFRAGIGLGRYFELDDDVYLGGVAASGNSVALRWQILGSPMFESKAGDTALTLSLRNSTGAAPGFTSTDITNNSYYSADLSLNSNDASLVLGHRFFNAFGMYIGGKDIAGTVTANYRATQNGPVVSTQNRSFSAYGGLMGLYISALGKNVGLNLVIEGEYMNVPATYFNTSNWVSDYSVSLSLPFHF